jgi:hypothetical protein
MEDGVDVTRRNLIEFTDTEQAHEDENEDTEVMGPPKKIKTKAGCNLYSKTKNY